MIRPLESALALWRSVTSSRHVSEIADYTKAIELHPKDAKAYFHRGVAYHSRDDYKRAIADYTKAIELNPKYADAYYNRWSACVSSGFYWGYDADYTKAIELNPIYAYPYLGGLWQSLRGAKVNRNSAPRYDRSKAKFTFEILPGEGIGPFRLGMTREQVREIAQRDLASDIEASKFGIDAELDCDSIGDIGLHVDYDKNGHANCIWGAFGWARSAAKTPDSAFMLFGKDVTVMTNAKVIQLCESHWTDVLDRHFSIDVPSAGLEFTYFENRTDGDLCAVSVLPPES